MSLFPSGRPPIRRRLTSPSAGLMMANSGGNYDGTVSDAAGDAAVGNGDVNLAQRDDAVLAPGPQWLQ
jgi:hypothetical protein